MQQAGRRHQADAHTAAIEQFPAGKVERRLNDPQFAFHGHGPFDQQGVRLNR
jgi:hypothetical protein